MREPGLILLTCILSHKLDGFSIKIQIRDLFVQLNFKKQTLQPNSTVKIRNFAKHPENKNPS